MYFKISWMSGQCVASNFEILNKWRWKSRWNIASIWNYEGKFRIIQQFLVAGRCHSKPFTKHVSTIFCNVNIWKSYRCLIKQLTMHSKQFHRARTSGAKYLYINKYCTCIIPKAMHVGDRVCDSTVYWKEAMNLSYLDIWACQHLDRQPG